METHSEDKSAAAALNRKGIRLTDAGRYGEAISVFGEAIALGPDMAGLYFNRAEARRHAGDIGGARQDLETAARLEPGEADFLHAQGLLAYEADDYASAIGLYQQALALDPANAQAWNDLGVIRFRQSGYSEARDCFSKAVTIDPDLAEAWFNLADTFEELGMPAERREALAQLKAAESRTGRIQDRD
jgi:tetratricopeptide (TPR) repeat protein